MLSTTLAGLKAHKLRLLLTSLAIMLGVGFIVGTFVLTDTMESGYDEKFAASAGQLDLVVRGDLDAKALAAVRAVPGVEKAAGTVRGALPLLDKDGNTYGDGAAPVAVSMETGRLARFKLTSGRAPGPGEVALDQHIAANTQYKIGDTLRVVAGGARVPLKIVGLVDFGLDQRIGLDGGLGLDVATATRLTGNKNFSEIDVLGTAGKDAIAKATGSSEVLTGAELSQELSDQNGADIRVIKSGLLMFGLVALLVSGMVIYNTFAIIITQRMREFALLRCVGASRRQIFQSVLIESVAVGVIGSVIGIGVGVGLGVGALQAVNAAGGDVPIGSVGLAPVTVLIALLVGIVVTVLSALVPARTATRIPPIRALGDQHEPGTAKLRLGRLRWTAVATFLLTGAAVTALGRLMKPGEAALLTVAVGGALVFLAIIAMMPALVRPLAGLSGALPARFGGVAGRLAVDNARRTPRRTATSAIALSVGIGLMSMFVVVAASGKATSTAAVDKAIPVDFVLHPNDDKPIPHAAAEALRARPEIAKVSELRSAQVKIGENEWTVGTVTPQDGLGAPDVLARLAPGEVYMLASVAKDLKLTVGGKLKTGSGTFTVAAIDNIDLGDLPVILMGNAGFDQVFPKAGATTVFVNGKDGADAKAAVREVVRAYGGIMMNSTADLRTQMEESYDTMLLIFGSLLGLAVLIALFGIVNTLTLSVIERTRESALLRALGLTRNQLRRMLLTESLVMAVIGALVGVTLGLLYGWVALAALSTELVFALPVLQLLGLLLLAAVAGALAGVLPARRAARASIVASIA